MAEVLKSKKITGQGVGSPEPVVVSNLMGSLASSSSKCQENVMEVDRLASISSNASSEKNSVLYNELKKANETISSLKKENKDLKKSLDEIMKRLSSLEEVTQKDEKSEDIFHTDEEDLVRETDWIIAKNKGRTKKRKANSSPEISPQRNKNTSIYKIENKKIEAKEIKKVLDPPPINVAGIDSYNNLLPLIKAITNVFKVNSLNNNVWKINVSTEDDYRKLTLSLTENKIQWYSYQNKNTRPIKVMARNLHHSCKPEEILENLKERGYDIVECSNIMKKERDEKGNPVKRPLPLFMLGFNNTEDLQKIYDIKQILGLIVKIEPIKKKNIIIPQCQRCQGFNHTKKFCQIDPRCVKCAGRHLTNHCTQRKEVPAKCINCKGSHPASYRGCEVAKELQKRRDKILNNKRPTRAIRKTIVEKNQETVENNREQNINILAGTSKQTKITNHYSAAVENINDKDSSSINQNEVLLEILNNLKKQEEINNTILVRLGKIEKDLEIQSSKLKIKN